MNYKKTYWDICLNTKIIYQALLGFLTILNMKSTLIEAYDMAWFLRATK
jgi:hypothetical protein